jgi:hypothetical protein
MYSVDAPPLRWKAAVVRARATDRLALYESADVSHQVESVRSGVEAGRGISRTIGVANWGRAVEHMGQASRRATGPPLGSNPESPP